MTYFRVICMIFHHIGMIWTACKWRENHKNYINGNRNTSMTEHLQCCPLALALALAWVEHLSFFATNWLSPFSLICSKSRTISLSTLLNNTKMHKWPHIKTQSPKNITKQTTFTLFVVVEYYLCSFFNTFSSASSFLQCTREEKKAENLKFSQNTQCFGYVLFCVILAIALPANEKKKGAEIAIIKFEWYEFLSSVGESLTLAAIRINFFGDAAIRINHTQRQSQNI